MQKISLKTARVNAGLTQEEAARAVHRGKQTISAWESGQSIIDANSFLALCELYRLDVDHIFLPSESNQRFDSR